ncbi:MAG: DUF1028 domain-containing protein [Kineosporiaceae bacterium]|nr:DUF1028 domain-containing protein [Kineosporiaceae bacterium]MBK8076416.1 DUF1028 domain-containing protein [Kineosporiaceae bacterium]
MTFSIVARSRDGRWGVGVASKYLAAPSAVAAARAGVGALATQAWCNLAWRPLGLARLQAGLSADRVVAELTAADPQRDQRQLGLVAGTGPGVTYTGAGCMDWAGGVAGGSEPGEQGEAYAIQGNILTGPDVVEAMQRAWLSGDADTPLAHRLLQVLQAGDAAGGDRRGRQSAGLFVVSTARREANQAEFGTEVAPDDEVDLRVDDHRDPMAELARLVALHDLYNAPSDPRTWLPVEGDLAREIDGHLQRLGYPPSPDGLSAWAGVENFENRLHVGVIEPVLLDHLRGAAADASG